jgi:hypothetical protein
LPVAGYRLPENGNWQRLATGNSLTRVYVQDLLQRVDIGIDEQAAVDFDCRIRSEVDRAGGGLQVLGPNQLVIHVML